MKETLDSRIDKIRADIKDLEEMPLVSDSAKMFREVFVAEDKARLARMEAAVVESRCRQHTTLQQHSDSYKFVPGIAFNNIKNCWEHWDRVVKPKCYVVGISGGVDSSVTAALAAKIYGKENILGVMMPNGEQKDISDSEEVCKCLGIKSVIVNIGKTYEELLDEVTYEALKPLGLDTASYDTKTNMPARLRRTTLYAIAQSVGGIVLNTCNTSESICGYDTLWGDNAGSYAPIQGLTKTEVIAMGDWFGLPKHLTHMTPVDGLQPLSDEQKLGFKYADLDRYIREDIGTPEFKEKVDTLYLKNKFKTDIVQIPHPNFDYLGNFVRYNNLPDVRTSKETR